MPETNVTESKESKAEKEREKKVVAVKAPIETAVIQQVQDMTLPQLLGVITRRLLEAVQNEVASATQEEINNSRRDLRLWYESQPVQNRAETAKKARKSLDTFKLIGEQMFHEIVLITLSDTTS